MTRTEQRAVIGLAMIMGLRMLGLFMVLPMFSLYANQLTGATPILIGLAAGIYGLAQAIFQIPFGTLSDRFGRKPIILIGLIIFAIGSLIAALADSITWMIVGRALQGMGAIGSTLLAMMADLTREEQRTKAMAIAGITIGFSFSVAMVIGPILAQWMLVNQLFIFATFLSGVAIIILYTLVPTPPIIRWQRNTLCKRLLMTPELIRLYSGIFILHALFTASFIVIPISFYHYAKLAANQQWFIYLPALIVAAIISLFCISLAERKHLLKPYFLGAIITLAIAEGFFCLISFNIAFAAIGLCLFFTGFSLLEAFLPSLISRTAPATHKGTALGIYSFAQFSGIFVGGVLGGWLYSKYHLSGVYIFCIIIAAFWFILAFFMQSQSVTTQHPDFIRLQEQLQSE